MSQGQPDNGDTMTHPVQIRGLDHVVIRANDSASLIEFYCAGLGCTIEREEANIGLTQLRAGNALIDIVAVDSVLGREGGDAPRPTGNNMDHFCVQVDPWDPDAIRAHLTAHGIDAPEPVSRYGALGRGPSIYIKDPEGNIVELKGDPDAG